MNRPTPIVANASASRRRALRALAVAASAPALALPGGGALAQSAYPGRPVRFVVPFPAGSGTDTMSRMLLDEVRKAVPSATFVVENRPGALGAIGTAEVVRAAPDGYTVMMSSSATHSSGPQLVKKPAYDALKDFTHLARLATFDVAMLVAAGQPWKSVADVVADARRRPDALTYGYGSATAQVAAASFVRSAKQQVRGVPYKGQPPALTDLIGGQITFVMADLGVALPHVQSGRLLPIAVASPRRSSVLPAVPTFTELGIAEVELQGWVGVSGPAGLPPEVVDWWSRQVAAAAAGKDLADRLAGMSVEPAPLPAAAMNEMVSTQFQVWGRRIRDAGIEPE